MNDTSTYDLERIKELVVEGRRIITPSALRGARSGQAVIISFKRL